MDEKAEQPATGQSLDSKLSSAMLFRDAIGGTGNYQEAAREFERAVETEPTNDDAFAVWP